VRGLLFRHLCAMYLRLGSTIFFGVLTVFLVADFVDRAKSYTGPNWIRDVLVLYGYKTVVAGHQLAPAALLLGAGALVAVLRSKGELTAIQALGFSPWTLYGGGGPASGWMRLRRCVSTAGGTGVPSTRASSGFARATASSTSRTAAPTRVSAE